MTASPESPAAQPIPAPDSPAAAAERILLVVDDDAQILETLVALFKGSYRVVEANSGAAALVLLKEGLRPNVILSDNRMPELAGVDFLRQSMAIAPDAVRAIMTAYSDLREILAAISRGHIYLYLTKPWQVVELVQAVRLCFQHYDLNLDARRIATEVETQSKVLKEFQRDLAQANEGYIDQNHTLVSHLVKTAQAFGAAFEDGAYHIPHGEFIARLARAVAYMVGFSERGIAEIEVAAHLHDLGKVGLPRALRAADPDALAEGERALYESHVVRGVQFLRGMGQFENVLGIIAQHHERPDGHGFPNRIEGRDFCRESQIVALADFYHNQAYRLTPDEEHRRQAGERIVLADADREARQAAAATRFADIEGAYDPRVVQAFHAVSVAGTVEGFRLLSV